MAWRVSGRFGEPQAGGFWGGWGSLPREPGGFVKPVAAHAQGLGGKMSFG